MNLCQIAISIAPLLRCFSNGRCYSQKGQHHTEVNQRFKKKGLKLGTLDVLEKNKHMIHIKKLICVTQVTFDAFSQLVKILERKRDMHVKSQISNAIKRKTENKLQG